MNGRCDLEAHRAVRSLWPTKTITWTDNISGNVKIRLFKGSTVAAIIAASTPSNGSFNWTVPMSLADGSNYKVEVRSLEDSSIRDRSDRSFTIRN